MRYGEYLLDKEIISINQLEDALVMQMDNKQLKLGEILLALGFMNRNQLIVSLKSYINETHKEVEEINDWVTQEEADLLIKEILLERK
ncbi:MAG: hypothetical protein OEV78_10575 [Spirochaetia bacterium]|nr:hypothetical protein [Spirochaetia bacterium]